MPKIEYLIMRPRYTHKKQIKIYYEVQFSTELTLNDENEKKNQLENEQQKNNPSKFGLIC
jgi:hypothetical protein